MFKRQAAPGHGRAATAMAQALAARQKKRAEHGQEIRVGGLQGESAVVGERFMNITRHIETQSTMSPQQKYQESVFHTQ